jgi:hypothetical protein
VVGARGTTVGAGGTVVGTGVNDCQGKNKGRGRGGHFKEGNSDLK